MIYLFICDKSHRLQVECSHTEINKYTDKLPCPDCGLTMRRDWQAEGPKASPPDLWRGLQWSDSCGVCSSKIDEERRRHPKHIFRQTEEGTYQRGFTGPAHKRQCLKELGLVDKRTFV